MNIRRRLHNSSDVAFYVPAVSPFLSSAAIATAGGAEIQIVLVSRALARRGARVRLCAFELPGYPIPSSIDDVEIMLRPPYRSYQRLGKLRETFTLFRTVIRSDADVVVTRAAGPQVGLAALAAKLAGRRFVYSSANLSDFDFGRLEPSRRNRFLFRLGIRLADRIIVQTDEQVSLCQERLGRQAIRISSISEPAAPRSVEPEAFLWVGRIVWYKRPLQYLALARALPNARFWMVPVAEPHTVGGPALQAELEREAAELDNLEVLAPMPRAELLARVDRCVAIVNTSDFEGMPNVFLEAWSRGVPAIALTHDPDGVVTRHGLGAFAQSSPERLAQLATDMWEGRFDQRELADRCRGYMAEHHSPEVIGASWYEALGLAGRSDRPDPRDG